MSKRQVINVSMVPHRSPFRYPGGKTWLYPYVKQWLKSLPPVAHFIEPFAGGANIGLCVLFDRLATDITLVEMDKNVGAVWQVILNGKGTQLASEIVKFKMTHENVRKTLAGKSKDRFSVAFRTILRNRVQHGGIMAPGASLMKKGENGKGLSSRWYPQTLQRRLLELVEAKDQIEFIQGDGIAFMARNAWRTDAVFYIDPPYTVAGRRLYAHSDVDHALIFRVASEVKGDFLMSYDFAPAIQELADKHRFDTAKIPMQNRRGVVQDELLIGRNLTWLR